jgi:putative membrane protein
MLVRLAIALGINAAGLWVADKLFAGVQIHGWKAYVIAAIVLAIANAVIKPVLKLLTFPLVILTAGLFLLVINIAMVALTVWITPNFSINGFWTYVGTVIVLWVVNWAAHEAHDRLD